MIILILTPKKSCKISSEALEHTTMGMFISPFLGGIFLVNTTANWTFITGLKRNSGVVWCGFNPSHKYWSGGRIISKSAFRGNWALTLSWLGYRGSLPLFWGGLMRTNQLVGVGTIFVKTSISRALCCRIQVALYPSTIRSPILVGFIPIWSACSPHSLQHGSAQRASQSKSPPGSCLPNRTGIYLEPGIANAW